MFFWEQTIKWNFMVGKAAAQAFQLAADMSQGAKAMEATSCMGPYLSSLIY